MIDQKKYVVTTTCGEETWQPSYVESRMFEFRHKEYCQLKNCKVKIQIKDERNSFFASNNL